jgi:beta-lactamase regulating signal transducer with metallopeptidase domain/HEAT repeat protein
MIVRTLGWALVHALWECGVLSVVLTIALTVTRRASPVVRYRLVALALALAIVLPAATALLTVQSLDRIALVETNLGGANRTPASDSAGVQATESVAPVSFASIRPATGPAARVRRSLRDGLESRFVWLIIAWLGGVAALSARALGGVLYARRLVRVGSSDGGPAVASVARRLEDTLGIRTATRIVTSPRVMTPFVTGVLKPIIVFPAALLGGLAPAQVEMVLAHELAHIWRRDVLVNLLQAAVETLLFFHPAIWWMSARMREEREHCCDDLAIAACGGDRVAYTETLLALEEARADAPAFALAATGGSLLRRALRLLRSEPAHADLGLRWAAGALTAFVALAASGPTARATAQTPFTPNVVAVDTAGAQPKFVLPAPNGATLADRWRAAESAMRSRGERSYWIGYRISRATAKPLWYYLDQRTPAGMGDRRNANYSTRMQFDGSDLSGVRITGIPLAAIVGRSPPGDVVILLGLSPGDGGSRLTRTHVANAIFPVNFENQGVAWLGAARDTESVKRLTEILGSVASRRLQADIIAAIGLHTDSRVAAPPLLQVLQNGSADDQLRAEAASWLEHHPTRDAIATLASVSRDDRSNQVRHKAVFAFAHMPADEASDTLRRFATRLDTREMRLAAIDALGHRLDQETVAFLAQQVVSASDDATRDAGLSALANMEDALGLSSLVRFAEASESEELERKAIEKLGDFDDARAVGALLRVAQTHRSPQLERVAAEQLGGSHPHEAAISALLTLARSHARAEVRREAVDGLGEFEDEPAATDALRSLSRSAADSAVRSRAAELLRDR